ncbi:hypothetical protein Pan97_50890 [Bremerella volcania]|uniref:DUF4261 domain-containing protein n=1 Tax=Bremerella volcania TaxID=2527984 RepID=A0A518CFK7_9BACT|nr:hypothetical protein [Bremerella volcania]QDU78010.1 hypothetical protein Pan97_50890 [Bremerella volcania]
MSKAVHTQALALLTKRVFSLKEIQEQLEAGELSCTIEQADDENSVRTLQGKLPSDGPIVAIEIVEAPWPAKIEPEQDLGPFSYSGALERACKFNVNWTKAAEVAAQHQGVVLVRMRNETSEPSTATEVLTQLMALAKVSLSIGLLPDVAGYFCPGGEIFVPVEVLDEILQASKVAGFPPLDLFANLRLSWLDDRWIIFETIGNAQLGLRDFEVYADSKQHDLNDIAAWLRRWSWQHLQAENALEDGSVASGPGEGSFDVVYADDALLPPKRPVIRLIAQDEAKMPEGLPARLRIDRA